MISPADWVLAVDFGTTYTKAATADAAGTQPVLFDGRTVMPSAALQIGGTDTWLAGEDAIRDADRWPEGFEPSPKSRIPLRTPQQAGDRGQAIPAIAALLRTAAGQAASQRAGRPPAAFVVTHPADVTRAYASALESAAAAATEPDWPRAQFMSEPVAAAQAILGMPDVPQHARLVVLDNGGGMPHATVVDRDGGLLTVVTQQANVWGGSGEGYDDQLVRLMVIRAGAPGLYDRLTMTTASPADRVIAVRLRLAAREAKERLSGQAAVTVALPPSPPDLPAGALVTVTRQEFEDLATTSLTGSVNLVSTVLFAARPGPPVVGIMLTGGGAAIPRLAVLAGERTIRPLLSPGGDPVTATARGAAQCAYRALTSPGTPGITASPPVPETTAPEWGVDRYPAAPRPAPTPVREPGTATPEPEPEPESAAPPDPGPATGAPPAPRPVIGAPPSPVPGSVPEGPPIPGAGSVVFGSSTRSGTTSGGGIPQTGPPAPGQVVDEDVRFTVYRPEVLRPGQWAALLVFTHKTDLITEPGQNPVDPVRMVQTRASAYFGGQAPRPVGADARHGLTRGTQLRIVPDLPGIRCNPNEVLVHWWEPVHQAEFRLLAAPGQAGRVIRGAVRIWCGPLIFGEVSVALRIEPARAAVEPPVPTPISPYRKIFPSYSHLDRRVVAVFAEAARALGDQYLQDVLALRAGERWNARLLELIEDADVFQLFWSNNSMRSRYCQQEWEHALALGRPAFVRPLYWEDPMPADPGNGLPPATLRELHFVKVPLLHRPVPPPEPKWLGDPPRPYPWLVWKYPRVWRYWSVRGYRRVGRNEPVGRYRRGIAVRAAVLVALLAALVYLIFQFVIR